MWRLIGAALLLGLLNGCGGGGTDGTGNSTPVAEAGPAQFAELNQVVYLDGSGSSDADGDALNFLWHVAEVPAGSEVDDSTALGVTDAVVSILPDVKGRYRLELTVNDGADSATDSVTIACNGYGTLNDTGQTRFTDSAVFRTVEPVNNPGQDGSFGRDVDPALEKIGAGAKGFDFTKIDADGNDLPGSAPHWNCVRDNVTGLVWEVKTDDGGAHDKDTIYTHSHALGLPATINAGEGLCGASDWRLPGLEELRSLVDYGIVPFSPVIDTDSFPNTGSTWYWAKETYAGGSGNAWVVYFGNGDDYIGDADHYNHVRLVRGGPLAPANAYTDNSDGTVTDQATGLIWKKCSEGQNWDGVSHTCTGTAASYTWQQALQRAQDVNGGSGEPLGYSDWRPPNQKELSRLEDLNRTHPSIDTATFPATPSSRYWSNTPYAGDAGYAWGVNFDNGDDYIFDVDSSYHVRLVRGGQ